MSRSAKRRKAAPWMRDVVTSRALLPAKKAELTLVRFLSVIGMRCVLWGFLWSCISSAIAQGLNDFEPGHLIPSGIWTLADIMDRGKESKTCPYFTIRRMVSLPGFPKWQCLKRAYFRCHSSTSLSTRFTTYWTQKWQNKFRKNFQKTRLWYLTRHTTSVRLSYHVTGCIFLHTLFLR